MTLSAPDDVDDPADPDTVESDTDTSQSSENGEKHVQQQSKMIEVFGGEMTVKDAVTIVADVIDDPSTGGIATAERVEELEKENERLRARLNEHKESLRTVFQIMDEADSIGQFSMSDRK